MNTEIKKLYNELSTEQDKVNQIILQSVSLNDLGLYNGKIGVCIFLVEYAKIKNNIVYNDIAAELLNNIVSRIHKKLSIDFSSGVSGIGWGLEYLLQNYYFEGDSYEVCEELDSYIMKHDPRRITDYSFDTGIGGIFAYVLTHIHNVYRKNALYPFDETYLNDLFITADKIIHQVRDKKTVQLLEQYISFYKTKEIFDPSISIMSLFDFKGHNTSNELSLPPIGLRHGFAGAILNDYKNKL